MEYKCNTKLFPLCLMLITVLLHGNRCNGQTTATSTANIEPTVSITTMAPISTTPVLSEMFSTSESSSSNSTTSTEKVEPTTATDQLPDASTSTVLTEVGSGSTTTAEVGDEFGSGSSTFEVTTQTVDATDATTTFTDVATSVSDLGTDAMTFSGDGFSISMDATTSSLDTSTQLVEETTPVNEGSGVDATTSSITSAMTTDIGSGFPDDVATSNAGTIRDQSTMTRTFTTPIPSNETSESTTFINETTIFEITTGIAAISTGLPWYIIVIICLGILILILLIVFIIICCLYKKASKTPVKKQPQVNMNVATETVQGVKLQPMPGYVSQAPTIKPAPEKEVKAVTNFMSETPMTLPATFDELSSTGRKRGHARPTFEPKSQSFDEDEGFIEPLARKNEKQRKKVRKRHPPPKTPEQHLGSDSELSERAPQYRPYYLPTPVQTALTSKGLGDTLTDDALAARHALQRRDIERHRNKQRLRQQQRNGTQGDAYRDNQRSIDAVLAPPPPTALQGLAQRKIIRMKHARHSEMKHLIQEKDGRYKRNITDAEDSEGANEKPPSHEAVIAKMAKLLEQAYALLTPAVQRNLIGPALSQNQNYHVPPPLGQESAFPVLPPPPPMPEYYQQAPRSSETIPNARLFTRVQTPPAALLPQEGSQQPNTAAPIPKYYGQVPLRHNDANSVVWTPYRTYDQLVNLQDEDPTLLTPSGTRASHASPIVTSRPSTNIPNSDILLPRQPPGSVPNDSLAPHPVPNPNAVTMYYPTTQPSSVVQPPNGFDTRNTELYPHQHTVPPSPNIDNAPVTSQYSTPTYLNSGTDEPATSIVQSIKDTLAKLAGTSTPVQELEPDC